MKMLETYIISIATTELVCHPIQKLFSNLVDTSVKNSIENLICGMIQDFIEFSLTEIILDYIVEEDNHEND